MTSIFALFAMVAGGAPHGLYGHVGLLPVMHRDLLGEAIDVGKAWIMLINHAAREWPWSIPTFRTAGEWSISALCTSAREWCIPTLRTVREWSIPALRTVCEWSIPTLGTVREWFISTLCTAREWRIPTLRTVPGWSILGEWSIPIFHNACQWFLSMPGIVYGWAAAPVLTVDNARTSFYIPAVFEPNFTHSNAHQRHGMPMAHSPYRL